MTKPSGKKSYGKIVTPKGYPGDGMGTPGTRKLLDVRGQESVSSVKETDDIRKQLRGGNPFVPSTQKQLKREWRGGERAGEVGRDEQLHADTTQPADNVVKDMSKGGWAESSKTQLKRQRTDEPRVSDTDKDEELEG